MLTLEPFTEDHGRSMVLPDDGVPPVSFLAPQWVCRPPARIHVRLLGPCFKTGRMKSSIRQRPERAVGENPTGQARALRSSATATA